MEWTRTDPLPLAAFPLIPAALGTLPGARVRCLPVGTALVFEGEPTLEVCVVLDGALTLSSTATSGRRATIALLGRGSVLVPEGLFGDEAAPFRPEVRSALTTRVWRAPAASVAAISASSPEVARWLAHSLHRQLRVQHARLAGALSLSLPARLLALLRDLAGEHGRPVIGGRLVEPPLSQETLGSMVGAARESVNRALRALEAWGTLTRLDGRYVVVDAAAPPAVAPDQGRAKRPSSSERRATAPSASSLSRWARTERAAGP